ncbi:MAG: tetratricopeptide repeat protein [Nitrospirae bacterium]|nr:tetratricopeptide repeat protein [Nitrospirota bacterium]
MSDLIWRELWPWLSNDGRWIFISALAIGCPVIYRLSKTLGVSVRKTLLHYVSCFIVIIIGLWCVYYYLIPVVLRPPQKPFTILIVNFEPVADDANNEAKNFPDRLMEKLEALEDKNIRIKKAIINIEGNTPKKREEFARKIGRKYRSHLVVYGKVRCEEGKIPPADCKYLDNTNLQFTQDQIPKLIDINRAIAVKSSIELKYSDVAKIEDVVKFIIGMRFFCDGEYSSAVDIMDSMQNKDQEVYGFIFTAYMFEGDYEKALQTAEKETELFPANYIAYIHKGVALSMLKRDSEAITAINVALTINPNDAEAHYNKGTYFLEKHRNKEANEEYDRAIKLDPDYLATYRNKGCALDRLGRYDEAIETYKKAINIEPKNAELYYRFGTICGKRGRYQEALAALDKTLEINPDFKDAYYNKGIVYVKLGQDHAAVKMFDKVIEIDPQYALAYYYKGVLLSMLGQSSEASNALLKANEIDPSIGIPEFPYMGFQQRDKLSGL